MRTTMSYFLTTNDMNVVRCYWKTRRLNRRRDSTEEATQQRKRLGGQEPVDEDT